MTDPVADTMPTEALYRRDAYLQECTARVAACVGDEAVVLDRTVFFAGGGGQPCDTGWIMPEGGTGGSQLEVRAAGYGEGGVILHHLTEATAGLNPGDPVRAGIDWERRNRIMRMHTALHLLSVALPYPVTGGQVGSAKSRLDFNMPESPDRELLAARLNTLVEADYAVGEIWIEESELRARPELVKTVGARPPAGVGPIRLVRIGADGDPIDLQPCGGTHVRSTAEIGRLLLGKMEKKGRHNRRVNILLED